ncbi:MAG TPA: heme exporter protein CcmD [Usitatibacter sp.]|nr:heme exporter protein CcmD [Usitatibacter sp.]
MKPQFYIWMSYGMTALAIAVEIVALRVRRARSLRRIEEERDLEAQD